MTASETLAPECVHSLENLAAELTEAVLPLALAQGAGDDWLDLELDLWRTLAETAEKWGWAPSSDRGLLGALAGAAYHTTLRHGGRESSPPTQPGLYQAFRSAMRDTVTSFQRATA